MSSVGGSNGKVKFLMDHRAFTRIKEFKDSHGVRDEYLKFRDDLDGLVELVYGRLARVEEWARVRSRVARAVAARVCRVALQARPEMGVGRVTGLGRYPRVRNRHLQR